MAYIKTLKDNELIGGADNTDVYPITTSQALYRQNPDGTVPYGIKHQRLEESLQDIEADAKDLHEESEKMTVYLTKSCADVLEINETTKSVNLTGNVNIEHFGDAPAVPIDPTHIPIKQMSVLYGGSVTASIPTTISGNDVLGSYEFPNVVGEYNFKFHCVYNSVTKDAEVQVNMNLRKYFGFLSQVPVNVTNLHTSHFSNDVACTVTIPSDVAGFQRIYFAVPNNMSITRVTQPDALNAPLAIDQVGTVTRTISGTPFTYKLYQSTDLIDSSVSKRLTIS